MEMEEAFAFKAGSAGSSPCPDPWLSPSVSKKKLRPAPSTPSPSGEYDTRSRGASFESQLHRNA